MKKRVTRRQFLIGAGAVTAAAATGVGVKELFNDECKCPPKPKLPANGVFPWKNWSGALECTPGARIAPASTEELAAALKNSTGPVRPVGAGHSFSALVPTDGTLVSLARFSGIESHNPETLEATIGGGTRLGAIGEPLKAMGQAMINMPDIDQQTLAGSIATATHGTGLGIGSLSSFVTGFELVTVGGDVLWCDKDTNSDIFEAGKVSMGALGIMTKIRMQNQEPYKLERKAWTQPVDDILSNLDTLGTDNRNVDIYFIPYSEVGAVITHNVVPDDTKVERLAEETNPLKDLQDAECYLGWSKALRKVALNFGLEQLEPEREVDWSHKIYPSVRNTRFNEMEYHLPYENGPAAMREILDTIYDKGLDINFPIEFRLVGEDKNAWLSPFEGREKTCSIAVHQYHDIDPTPYFSVIEPILKKHGGRPHWGKQHTMDAKELSKRYPNWDNFMRVRQQLDPEGRLLNPHLSKVLGVKPGVPKPAPQKAPAP
ncbi:MAG: FAD-binding protein [Alphaproteobacteria bacterium]|nr:FAD-binding protein [Alphaproteobacteria bacterium]